MGLSHSYECPVVSTCCRGGSEVHLSEFWRGVHFRVDAGSDVVTWAMLAPKTTLLEVPTIQIWGAGLQLSGSRKQWHND